MDTQWCVKVSSACRGECVATGGLCRPALPVRSTFELHRNKSLTVFFLWCAKVGGGGCLGFQRGAVWCEFRALTAWGIKLLSSLAERALILRYRLPEGRSWKRLWEGWVGSFTILFALLKHRVRKISRMEGRGAPMIFAAVFTVRWRVLRSAAQQFPYQTVMQLVSTLSMVPL